MISPSSSSKKRTPRNVGTTRLLIFVALSCAPLFPSLGAELSKAEVEGRALVADLLAEEGPTESYSQTGVLKIRDRERHWTEIPFRLRIVVTVTNQAAAIEPTALIPLSFRASVTVTNRAVVIEPTTKTTAREAYILTNALSNASATTPIAGSDLWVGDVSMDFLHWPEQRLLKSEMRRGRSCKVLESVSPAPTTSGYSRVVSWVDNETDGIVRAEVYDAHNKLFKECEPKGFKKVKGRWELRELRIRNLKTGTQTVMEFDLPTE
jgi:hypothetical protein